MVRITSVIKFLLLFSFFIYVVSVSWYSWKNMNDYFYFLKHFSVLLPAFFSIFFFIKRPSISKKLILFPFVFLLIIIPFAIRGLINIAEIIIFFQLFLFLLTVYVFSKVLLKNNVHFTKFHFIILLCIFLIPLSLDIFFSGSDFIYTSYYGRPRLLLGFFHPKEAGVSLLVLVILFKFYYYHKISFWNSFLFEILIIILLYFMQSRNTLLFYLNFLIINRLLTKINVLSVVFLYVVIPVVSLASVTVIYFKEINNLTSNRLEHWVKTFDFSILGKGSSMADFSKSKVLSKLHVDNFYLEYLIENGFVLFSILLILLFSIVFFLDKIKFNSIHINALFISFLIFCFFDAGMFSSGNFLNIFIWALVFSSLQNKVQIGKMEHKNTSMVQV